VTEVSALSAAGWAWSMQFSMLGVLGVVDTGFAVSQPTADAEP